MKTLAEACEALAECERGHRVADRLLQLLDTADLHNCDSRRLAAVEIIVRHYCEQDRHAVVRSLLALR